jgi:hypothetical protein
MDVKKSNFVRLYDPRRSIIRRAWGTRPNRPTDSYPPRLSISRLAVTQDSVAPFPPKPSDFPVLLPVFSPDGWRTRFTTTKFNQLTTSSTSKCSGPNRITPAPIRSNLTARASPTTSICLPSIYAESLGNRAILINGMNPQIRFARSEVWLSAYPHVSQRTSPQTEPQV